MRPDVGTGALGAHHWASTRTDRRCRRHPVPLTGGEDARNPGQGAVSGDPEGAGNVNLKPPTAVVGYVRVSTTRQRDEGVSLAAQESRIYRWAADRGVDAGGVTISRDEGISGSKASNRPGLAQALDLATASKGRALVVYSLSRLARSIRDTLSIAERLEQAEADLVSLSEALDTTSAAGRMIFRLLAVLAEFERDLVVERTEGAIAFKRSMGQRIGQVPYGSRVGSDGTTLERDQVELAAVEAINQMSVGGLGSRAIAREMDARGYPTKSGRPWSESTVRQLLKRVHADGHAEDVEGFEDEDAVRPAARPDPGAR
jgi:site-specific DNA recombinase